MNEEIDAGLWKAFDDTTLEFVASVSELKQLGWERYFVITAWNPFSQKLSLEENRARNRDLVDDLLMFEMPFSRVIGHSSTWDWFEESFAVKDIEKALELGRKYEQHAIFEIQNEDRKILRCFE
jgi:Protein of unknown function (DUF3293)